MTALTLMVQGTGSSVGKSAVVTGLCRWFHRRGLRVAPFKPQNMALNSAVTADGGEIGRAQAVQAQACGLEPRVDMNPVLLKPTTETGAQVIIDGRPAATMDARGYHDYKAVAREAVLAAHARLAREFNVIVAEGAGSPAEINLRANDIANMGFAEAVDCPVLLVGDIDRGGVFAQLVGTLELLDPAERDRVAGFIINGFRGDRSLLEPGLEWLRSRTGVPVYGVIPFIEGLYLEAEDSLGVPDRSPSDSGIHVVVPALPRISNHTDLDPLRLHPGVTLTVVGPGRPPPPGDLIVLPGSKSVAADLDWLRQHQWHSAIQRHLRYGGCVLGLCGGFQMLGRCIRDPHGLEGPAGDTPGLGLLDVETELRPAKRLTQASGTLALERVPVTGYEIHMGVTTGAALQRPAVHLSDGRGDGAVSADGRVLGTYLHGLLESGEALAAVLRWAGLADPRPPDHAAMREAGIDRLAHAVEHHLHGPLLTAILGGGGAR